MKLPNKVKIGPVVFDVELVKKLNEENGDHLDGDIDYRHAKIKIYSGNAKDVMRHILLHEVLHGVINDSWPENAPSEADITRIASALSAMLLDNPKFVKLWRKV